ncbi:Peroxin-3 [Durotheca rogersii]|uniref:Peroxin-3 n=1 Tax=Durotheca rogersii TaxID=419775 RepID=UPI00221F1741|nr:Peroxin-3 [Durotheca rogersii]KAI5863262.1 Peroxin-3 [Durotheca rogersii]
MISATRQWFRRNRTPLAIGAGVVGVGYLATQYVLNKINNARERMSSDRIAKENLRRRFEQNQEDCTFTVLALLPTATTNILETMNTEKITLEIQQMKGGTKNLRGSGESSGAPPSIADTNMTEEEGKSTASLQSESGVHASQMTLPPASSPADGAPSQTQEGGSDAGQAAPKPKKTKRQLWDDLTISSITRSFTLLYTLALLTMLTRIQLNLLGRRSYLSSVVSLATGAAQSTISMENHDDDNQEQAYGSDFETNRKYLTFSWWLLNRGWVEIMENVENAVREVFGHLSPRDLLSFDTFSQLTVEVRRKMERKSEADAASGRPGARWLPYLLPPVKMEDFVLRESGVLGDSAAATTQTESEASAASSVALRRLLDETSDLIESPAFTHVLGLLLDAGFSTLLYHKVLQGAFEHPTTASSFIMTPESSAIIELTSDAGSSKSRAVLLPKILSVLTRQAHAIGNGMPNEYLQGMEQVRDLEAFAAVVYSSNWENEIQDEGLAAAAARLTATGTGLASTDETTVASLGADDSTIVAQNSRAPSALGTGDGGSVVIVDPVPTQGSWESAWERAVEERR